MGPHKVYTACTQGVHRAYTGDMYTNFTWQDKLNRMTRSCAVPVRVRSRPANKFFRSINIA